MGIVGTIIFFIVLGWLCRPRRKPTAEDELKDIAIGMLERARVLDEKIDAVYEEVASELRHAPATAAQEADRLLADRRPAYARADVARRR